MEKKHRLLKLAVLLLLPLQETHYCVCVCVFRMCVYLQAEPGCGSAARLTPTLPP